MFLSALAGYPPPQTIVQPYTASPMWVYLRRRFSRFQQSLLLTDNQIEDGMTKIRGITACLNRAYWNQASETANALVVGSWGKGTQIGPPGDIDLMFFLPAEVYQRFEQRVGNRQSQLLQEIRDSILTTYSTTARIRGDGQVVSVPFNSVEIEVVPAFRYQNGLVAICDTNDGGRYKTVAPEAEINDLGASDFAWNGNTRSLVRMLKCWQRECNVPLKSFQLEIFAQSFLSSWPHSKNDLFWHDWMIRDFFAYLICYADGSVSFPTTGEKSFVGSDWLSKAKSAYENAIDACNYERDNFDGLAGQSWQKIFGYAVPGTAT